MEREIGQELLQVLIRRASVREFAPQPLPDDTIEQLVAAAQQAPTSSNYQAYSIVLVRETERRRELARLASEQAFVAQAAADFVFCPDLYRLQQVSDRQGYPMGARNFELFLVACVDAALAAENLMVAAEALGLGACPVGAVRDHLPEVSEMLKLPAGVFPLFAMAVGYPARPGAAHGKPRLPRSAVLHEEVYQTDPERLEQALARYDQVMAAAGVYRGRTVPIPPGLDRHRDAKRNGQVPAEQRDTGTLASAAGSQIVYGWAEHTARRLATANPRRERLQEILRERGLPSEAGRARRRLVAGRYTSRWGTGRGCLAGSRPGGGGLIPSA